MTNYFDDARNDVQTYFDTHEIPAYFYLCLFGELVKALGARLVVPNPYYCAEYDDDGNVIESHDTAYSYKEQIECTLSLYGGTAGWNVAFKEACMQCGLMEMYVDYSDMDWARSDIFDGVIAENLVKEVFDESTPKDDHQLNTQEDNII